MTGDRNCFLTFEKKDGGLVTFGNNDKGYSTTSKGYRVYNLKTQTVEISMHVIFDEYDEHSKTKDTEDIEVPTLQNVTPQNTISSVEKEDDQNVQDQCNTPFSQHVNNI